MFHRLLARLPAGTRNLLKRIPGASWLRDRLYGQPRGAPAPPGTLRPVVYLPTWLQWEVMKQRPQYLLQAFAAAGHEVWFVDPRLDDAKTVGERVHLVSSVRPTPAAGVILYTHFAPTQTLVGRFRDAVVVYDLLDDLAIYEPNERGMPAERTVRHHHRPLMEEADVVIVSNPVLAERHRGERDDLILVENGVDLERFTPEGPIAEPLSEGLVVGFHGAVAPWFDFDLMNAVCNLRPDLRFVLVGPVEPEVEEEAKRLADLPNVSFLPSQSSDRIAGFVRGFAVGLLPFVVDEMTEAVTPLKMYEYLASGVPVVSTPLPACRDHPAVATAADPGEFAALIDQAIDLDSGQRLELRRHADDAAWDRRIRPLLDRLEQRGQRVLS
ncbi:MAG TPA: glycosyltransferase [Acidimicrobiia bacterium]|nr:glycosyltransferase [Acidimicrobiia bacterium]